MSTAPSSGSSETSQRTDKELGDRNVEQNSRAKRKLPRLFSRYDSHTQKKKTGADNTALTAKNQFAGS